MSEATDLGERQLFESLPPSRVDASSFSGRKREEQLEVFAIAERLADGAAGRAGDRRLVEHETAPSRVSKGLARHLIPVMVLARLAVDQSEQGTGIGKGLFKDALLRTAAAADIAGVRALFVTAKDEDAKRFYERYNLDPSPADPMQFFLVMKDLKQMIAR